MSEASTQRTRRFGAALRAEERVTPLELFFDLVFVLAITQCTALMAASPTWQGLARGLLMLAALWWAWVGYAWLTSVVDPEDELVRLSIFGAMAALLVVSLCVPEAFDGSALLFACAYGIVRAGQIALFTLASRDDPDLRSEVGLLATSSGIGVGLLVAASFTDGIAQGALWAVAILLDFGGPFVFPAKGWKLAPRHFAERHALIVIIALGESIVAIGVGAGTVVDEGIVAAAIVGTIVAAGLWWLYFDVVALVAERRLSSAEKGHEQNTMARDSYSYLHFPMVAGIVLVALGMKKTLAHVDDPLEIVPAVALFGGTAVYLLGHVLFRLRNVRTLNRQRLLAAAVLVALIPIGVEVPSLVAAGIVAAVLVALIGYESLRFADARHRVRHGHVEIAD